MGKELFAGADRYIFARAKTLRKQPTAAENMLWVFLKQKPLGCKFRRQHPYGIYILDFYCHQLKLAIEVDSYIHDKPEVKQNDQQRSLTVNQLGVQIMRFSNKEIMTETAKVQQQIETKIIEIKHDRTT